MKTVVITGASSGIGLDAALHFHQSGYTVFAGVRRPEDGAHLVARAGDAQRMIPLRLDVTDDARVAAAAVLIQQHVGAAGLDVLISNAGVAAMNGPSSCECCPLAVQQQVMDVNFFGAVRITRALLPLLRAARGCVVFNSALMAHTVIPFNAGYAASKCALEGWADSLRREVQPHGVRVAMIEAGYLATALEHKQQDQPSAAANDLYPLEAGLHAAMTSSAVRLAPKPSADPRRMSEAMLAAATAAHPAPRRITGTGARLIWLIGCLPDRIQDRLIRLALSTLAARGHGDC